MAIDPYKAHLHTEMVSDGNEPLKKNTLADFVGKLQNSPNFQDDPVVIQRQMRNEWH